MIFKIELLRYAITIRDYLGIEFRDINGGCMKRTYRKVCIDTYIHGIPNIHIIHNV